ncbi:MFS transporter [Paraburkholderia sp.]|uniref:MFS transporter n=1 Tax=Paraburkholderia sp. TaxID=1926495 RepID=UPI003D6EBCCA
MNSIAPEHAADFDADLQDQMYRKISRRLLPFLMICYTLSFIDRINVGFAHLQMAGELRFSDAVYGFGAGIFFIGYMVFEIPGNLLLARIGARLTLSRIMVLWGLGSAAMLFVRSPVEFYVCRFLLGVFEAGFFPGVMFYLGTWYPPARRAKAFAVFMTAMYAAGLIAAPVSGAILAHLDGVWRLSGWQWLFLAEGLPSCAMGVVAYFYLDDAPADARWLSDAEKARIRADQAVAAPAHADGHGEKGLLSHPALWLLCAGNFAIASAGYALVFWLPSLLRRVGSHDAVQIGGLSAFPFLCGIVAMLWAGRRADRKGAWRTYCVASMVVGAVAMFALASSTSTVTSVSAICVALAALAAALPTFWALPGLLLPRRAMAVTVATITTVGALGGFASPYLIGLLNTVTGSMQAGLHANAWLLALGSVAVYLTHRSSASGN